MSVYGKFFLDFMSPLFNGIMTILKALFEGIIEIFNIVKYVEIIGDYISELSGFGIIIVILSVLCLLAFLALFVYLIVKAIMKYVKYRKNLKKQDDLVEEIKDLNNDIIKLKQENDKYKSMADPEIGDVEYDENGNIINKLKDGESRFFKLTEVDEEMKNYTPVPTNNTITLNQLCEQFRNYSASKLKLYYDINTIRIFISSFASNRLIILQGISGTGKTSLAYAFGKFINNETVIASVQPSWRDSTELFGYFNEFTKRFNETELLKSMYEASYKENVYLALLDEMNISRVEYYFAEMLSILELPDTDKWEVELVSNVWPNDPVRLKDGKLKLPTNMWYVGTINNDDSTFMVTDKVYDRAMPIEIDEKSEKFEAPQAESINLGAKYFMSLFENAKKTNPVSQDMMDKLYEMDDYLIKHFRISFGNRIVKQINDFVPTFVACGGDEITAIDYIIAHKILRKFEQLNLSYIRTELDDFIKYLDSLFGKDKMTECLGYLARLKKSV